MWYQAEVSGWHDFYMLAGAASATLVFFCSSAFRYTCGSSSQPRRCEASPG
jgi:hypothetical protein